MSKFNYTFSEDLGEAAKAAREWFIAHGCPWAEMEPGRGKRYPRQVPTENEIKMEYQEMIRIIKKHKSQFCESGELYVELVPLRYGYRS